MLQYKLFTYSVFAMSKALSRFVPANCRGACVAFVESPFKAQPPLSCGYHNGSKEAAPNTSHQDLFFFF